MIRVENVWKTYETRFGARTVLQDINFEMQRGEHVGILGRNGAGKSTLIRILGGAEMPTLGRVHRGMSVSWPLAFTGGFQGHLTGLDNLRFICRIYGADYKRLIPFVEDFTELGLYLREPVSHYSTGMVARLGFALSMAIEFDCFLIDETMVVGDRRFHQRCNHELFHKRKDRAYIMVSHKDEVIRRHCHRASVLHEGRLYSFDTVNEAFRFYDAYCMAPAKTSSGRPRFGGKARSAWLAAPAAPSANAASAADVMPTTASADLPAGDIAAAPAPKPKRRAERQGADAAASHNGGSGQKRGGKAAAGKRPGTAKTRPPAVRGQRLPGKGKPVAKPAAPTHRAAAIAQIAAAEEDRQRPETAHADTTLSGPQAPPPATHRGAHPPAEPVPDAGSEALVTAPKTGPSR